MRLVKQLVCVAVVAFGGSLAVGAVNWSASLTLLLGFATAMLTLLVYAWVVRRTEKRAPVEVEQRGAGGALGRGMLIGFGLFTAVIANIAFLGDYRVDGWGSLSGAIALLGFMAAAAVTEEVLFRGVLFRIVEGWLGTWWALALTGVLFGASHLINPHASLWGALAIAVEGGGMLAAAYAATRTLWLPIGLHFAWNFAEGGLFGTGVSGTNQPQGLLHGVMSGSTWITGGDFGPEGSLYSVLAGIIATTVFLIIARRRGNLVPSRRHRAAGLHGAARLAQ
ncbi:lysostaphin resistance A-like protein [Micromonospora sp. NPDC093277]|uniref:CPBP family intramembrane glutamic endopeptidase n=1 Tax=Micromonospora sp. NPDC093277 TaxID=3364291 RepID=UPI003807C659